MIRIHANGTARNFELSTEDIDVAIVTAQALLDRYRQLTIQIVENSRVLLVFSSSGIQDYRTPVNNNVPTESSN